MQSSQGNDKLRIERNCIQEGQGCIMHGTCEHSAAAKMGPSWQSLNCKESYSKVYWDFLSSSLERYCLVQICNVAYLAQKQDVGSVISLLCPQEVRHTQHAPASHIQQTVPGPHLPQGPLPIGCEVVGAVHLYCYFLTCNTIIPVRQFQSKPKTIPKT
jgi:hypothetical protein